MSERKQGRRGIVLFAHGSREPSWKGPFTRLEKILSGAMDGAVARSAFLKDLEPGLFEVVAEMAEGGISKITVVPVFLAVGAHSARDFPEMERRLKERHPEIEFEWTQVMGQWDETMRALADVIAEKLRGRPPGG